MSGFDNEVVFANNVDFSGSASVTGQMTLDGQLLIGRTSLNAGGTHIDVGTLSAGTGIGIVNGTGTITISNTSPGGAIWIDEVATGPTNMVSGNGYVADNAALVVLKLPASSVFGDIIRVTTKGAGLWKITQGNSQQIQLGSIATTAGTGGFLQATALGDSVEILCITANLSWVALSAMGNITVV